MRVFFGIAPDPGAGMVDVKNQRCEKEGCMKRALFGYVGEKARFCGTDRLPGELEGLQKSLEPRRTHLITLIYAHHFLAAGGAFVCAFVCTLDHPEPGRTNNKIGGGL